MFNLAYKYFSLFDDIQTLILLALVEEYVNGAELQIQRIDRNRKVIGKTLRLSHDFESYKLTHKNRLEINFDTHFYFICIGQVSKCFERLCKKLKNKRLDKIRSEFNREFSREIRNDLEHIDNRVVGKKIIKGKEVDIGPVTDLKNFIGDNITFNGKRYPVNKQALNRLKLVYIKILMAIHEDYALKDGNFADKVAYKKLKKIDRSLQKEDQKYLPTSR